MTSKITSEHHAVLFALIAKEIITILGQEKGKLLIDKTIKKYGNQRGQRMALRAKQNNDDLSFWNYLAYQEWKVNKKELKKRIKFDEKYLHTHFIKCPWVANWGKHNLLEFGKLFCPKTDYALFEGFNPDINMQLLKNRANGDNYCDFHFVDEKFSFISAIKMGLKKLKLKNSAIKPWDYHTGHLYKTMKEIIVEEHEEKGEEIISNTLSEFKNIFDDEVLQIVLSFENTNFDIV